MAFENATMTDEEVEWENTLGLKDPRFGYKHALTHRPDGYYMTVDRYRKVYLLSICKSGDPRDPPDERTAYYFSFLSEDGLLLYFTSYKDRQEDRIVWHIASIDLFKNVKKQSKAEIFKLLSDALYVYGQDGFDPWDDDPVRHGFANYDFATLDGEWIE